MPTFPDRTLFEAQLATKVTLTGDETIAGVKTFTAKPVVPNGSFTLARLVLPGDATKFAAGDGQWRTPPGGSYDTVNQNADGTWPARTTKDPTSVKDILFRESAAWRDNPAYVRTLPADAIADRDSIELFV